MQSIICGQCGRTHRLYGHPQTAATDSAASKLAPYATTDMLVTTYTGRLLRPRVQWTDSRRTLAEAQAAGERGHLKLTLAECADATGNVKRDIKGRQTIFQHRVQAVHEVYAPDVVTTDSRPALAITGAVESLLDEQVARIERVALCRDALARKFNAATIEPPAPVCDGCGAALPLLLVDHTVELGGLGEREIAVTTATGYDLVTRVERSIEHPFTNRDELGASAISYLMQTRHRDLTFQQEPHSHLVAAWRPYSGVPRPSINTWAAEALEEHLTAAEAYVMLHEERP